MSHPAEQYVGIPYDENEFDCADLVVQVQRELFGRDVRLPNGRPRGVRGQLALGDLSKSYGTRTETPVDGDLVLMLHKGAAGHAGVYFRIGGEPWVLHANETNGMAVLHRLRELPLWGAQVEGVYRWA